jgi:transcriptional regulator with XRE-family HTH domain
VTKSIHGKKYRSFLELLVQIRKDAGLTQTEVAAHLRRPQSYVSKYENGEGRLDVVEFLEVAQVVGFDPVKFIRSLAAEKGSILDLVKY